MQGGFYMSLSVCLIVKNEEATISRCLNCAAKFADQIIVVDTGSTDGTVEEVKKFTNEIYFFDWCDDFSAARNFAFEKADKDYVMWLDADDIVTDENCAEIKKLVKTGGFDMAFLQYAAAFDGDKPTFVYYRERIFRRAKNYRFCGAVHEAVKPDGKIVYSEAAIYHKKVKSSEPFRNLLIYQKQIARGICLDERSLFYYGRELLFNGMIIEGAAVLEKFLSGGGWVENEIEACINLCKAYRALGNEKKSLEFLLKSFTYAPPRSEACCILGDYFFEKNAVNSAIYWYQLALTQSGGLKEGGFFNADYSGYIPNIQLCVLYDKLGDYARANAYNEAAGKYRPESQSYKQNKIYFASRLQPATGGG